MVDNILITQNNANLTQSLKKLFGLGHVTDDADFANQLAQGVGYVSEGGKVFHSLRSPVPNV